MTFDEYQQLSLRTAPRGLSQFDRMNMGAMGLSGEAGEVTDMLKKISFHGHLPDKEKIGKELGDVLWYISYLADVFGLSLSDVAKVNVDKLKERYPDGFDPERSKNR